MNGLGLTLNPKRLSDFWPFRQPFGPARISSTQQRAKYEVLLLLDNIIAGTQCHPQRLPARFFLRIVLYRHGAGVDHVFGPAGIIGLFLLRAAPAQRSHRSVLSHKSTTFAHSGGFPNRQLCPLDHHRHEYIVSTRRRE